ncbi:SDR family NAD(P)-dependent oxidoreductase [Acidaminobacter sp. JC074]|uniref:SDR family NAD(P)-dependent oxidoreductase n=1 Tax=Acidaminobacter sp. JC074 TaxID=2530199 RepID=UPI001F11545C|nr:SDR family NAD(P)-dependent oxidoreductase [Acidaminobacter sp. JC074]MCH4886424.1 SDR family NAD(P)-dependent oxidoreductase [Acidaminobacter sp. JC074]
MKKTILITGATDGIGKVTAKMLGELGHHVILHGRSLDKVESLKKTFLDEGLEADAFAADLSDFNQVKEMGQDILSKYKYLDVLINNAGVFVTDKLLIKHGLDVRFAVNTVAPYLLTKLLLPVMDKNSRVINLSSAAQASVDLEAVSKRVAMSDNEAYAQSKLALTMWTYQMADEESPIMIALNPKSFLGSKMVHKAYGTKGYDLSIGGKVLCKASLSDEFSDANGKYYDNDIEMFSSPHPQTFDLEVRDTLTKTLNNLISDFI